MSPQQQQAVMAKGTLSTARDPTAVLVGRMKQAKGDGKGIDFASAVGKSTVLVRGFDFGTSEAQISEHMSSVGTVQSINWIDDGSVCVTYSSEESAKVAAAHLQQTNITGNSRYLDVLPMDPKQFLADCNVEARRAEQF